jgi:hypothetical protein
MSNIICNVISTFVAAALKGKKLVVIGTSFIGMLLAQQIWVNWPLTRWWLAVLLTDDWEDISTDSWQTMKRQFGTDILAYLTKYLTDNWLIF